MHELSPQPLSPNSPHPASEGDMKDIPTSPSQQKTAEFVSHVDLTPQAPSSTDLPVSKKIAAVAIHLEPMTVDETPPINADESAKSPKQLALVELEKEIGQLEAKIESHNQQMQVACDDLEVLKQDMDEETLVQLQATLNISLTDIEKTKQELETLATAIEKIDHEMAPIEISLTSYQELEEATLNLKSGLEEDLEEYKKDLVELDKAILDSTTQLDDLELEEIELGGTSFENVSPDDKEVLAYLGRTQEITTQLNAIGKSIAENHTELKGIKNKMEKAENSLEEVNKELANTRHAIVNFTKQIGALKEARTAASKLLQAKEHQLTELENAARITKEEISNQQEEIMNQQKAITRVQGGVDELKKQQETLFAQLQTLRQKQNTLK